MSLSDDLLKRPEILERVRELIQELVSVSGARSAFLVDESGVPFAAQGNVEFNLPHPLIDLEGGALLAALVGEPPRPGVLVERAGPRALLAVLLSDAERTRAAAKARDTARRVASLLALTEDARGLP